MENLLEQRKPRTITNTAVGWIGGIVSFLTATVIEDVVKESAGETPSKWAVSKSRGFAGAFKEGALKLADPKQWKSSIAYVAIAAIGLGITEWLVNKIYNKPEPYKVQAIHPQEVQTHVIPTNAKSWVEAEQQRNEVASELSR
jgi:hypothetical protein